MVYIRYWAHNDTPEEQVVFQVYEVMPSDSELYEESYGYGLDFWTDGIMSLFGEHCSEEAMRKYMEEYARCGYEVSDRDEYLAYCRFNGVDPIKEEV